MAACGEDEPRPISLGDSGLPNSSPILFIAPDGTQVIAKECPLITGVLNANGAAVGILRLDTRAQWNLGSSDVLPLSVSGGDALVSLSSTGNGNGADGAPPSTGGVSGTLSASSPTLDVALRAGLTTGVARVTVSAGRFTQDVCLTLDPNPVAALALTVAPSGAPDSGIYNATATLITLDGTPPSVGTGVDWSATNCVALATPKTVLGRDSGVMTNTLYVPTGWASSALTASLRLERPSSSDAGAEPVKNILCLTPAGVAAPASSDAGCSALSKIVADAGGDAGGGDAGDAGEAGASSSDGTPATIYPCGGGGR